MFGWLAKALSRRSAAIRDDMRRESETWFVQCKRCGVERSVWARGGVRYKAAGEPLKYLKCEACGRGRWHRLYRKRDASPQPSVSGESSNS